MSDIAFYANELASKISGLEQYIEANASEINPNEPNECSQETKNRLYGINSTRRIFNMELRQSDGNLKSQYQESLRSYDMRIEKLKAQLNGNKNNAPYSQSTIGRRTQPFENTKETSPSSTLNDERREILSQANAVQDKTEEALHRTLNIANETTEIGEGLVTKLGEQNEQLDKIGEGLENIASELDKAKSVMTSFLKRVMTDKVILFFTLLVVLGLVGLIVYIIVDQVKK